MAKSQDFAALFERTLDLFRDPGAKGEQKAQFRTLAGLLKSEAVTIAVQDGRLWGSGTTRVSVRMQTFVFGTPIAPVSAPPPPPVPPPAPPAPPAPPSSKEPTRDEDIPEILRDAAAQ